MRGRGTWSLGRVALHAMLSLMGAGCFQSVPIRLAEARPDEAVEVRVTDRAATRLTRDLGVYAARLQGPVTVERGDSVAVAVTIRRELAGMPLEGARLPLFLARDEVVDVRRRVLSRRRTVLASAGVVAVFVMAVGSIIQHGDPNGSVDEPPSPPPVGLRIPFRGRP